MQTVLSLWRRLPVLVRAVLTGSLLAAVGTIPWAILVAANSKHWPAVPWAVPPTALYLWLYWRYVRGVALFAGVVGLVALVLFQTVMNRLITLPAQPVDDLRHVPTVTLVPWLLMSAAVAGIVEESSFRGYLQGPIERRHGPLAAILVTGSLFGLAHFTHPETTLALMPYYMGAAVVYGALAYLTNSIFPSVVLHAGGNVFSAIGLLAGGRAEWQASSTATPLVWETGADAMFWISCVATLVAGTAAVRAYAALARVVRSAG